MGLNKRYINYENTLIALQENKLNEYYGKTELFIFEDNICEYVYEYLSSIHAYVYHICE